jgi:hypothetical protein
MKTTLGAFAAVLLAGAMCTQPAHAQSVPQGSYLDSCTHVGMDRDRLIADCRRADGGWHRTVLDINRCVGDIGNLNGQLPAIVVPAKATARAARKTGAKAMARAAGKSGETSRGRAAGRSSIPLKGNVAGGAASGSAPDSFETGDDAADQIVSIE